MNIFHAFLTINFLLAEKRRSVGKVLESRGGIVIVGYYWLVWGAGAPSTSVQRIKIYRLPGAWLPASQGVYTLYTLYCTATDCTYFSLHIM